MTKRNGGSIEPDTEHQEVTNCRQLHSPGPSVLTGTSSSLTAPADPEPDDKQLHVSKSKVCKTTFYFSKTLKTQIEESQIRRAAFTRVSTVMGTFSRSCVCVCLAGDDDSV